MQLRDQPHGGEGVDAAKAAQRRDRFGIGRLLAELFDALLEPRQAPLELLDRQQVILEDHPVRPVFEAQNRGRPGLLMAALRYLVLTGPLAWAGMRGAEWLGAPVLLGLIAGLLAAAGASSALFLGWAARTLAPAR